MSSTAFQRKLDFAPTASIDKVALNNKVVLMRAIVRRAKLHTINALVKKMQKLRNKKGTEAQQNQNKSKADRLLEEVKIIKMLKPDYVSKYALGSTERFEQLVAKPSTTFDMRALARLSQHKFIQDVVDKFRSEHEDWQELVAYLMTKHTSREFKKKKTKENMKKVEANVKASETLVQKFLGEKLKGKNDAEENMDDDENESDGVSSSNANVVSENDEDNDDYDDVGSNNERLKGMKKQSISGRKDESHISKNQPSKKQRKMLEGNHYAIVGVNENSEDDEDIGDIVEENDNIAQSTDSNDDNSDAGQGETDSNDDIGSEDNNDTDSNSEGEEDSGHVSEDSPKKSDNKSLQHKKEIVPENKTVKNVSGKASPKKKVLKHKDLLSDGGTGITNRKNLLTEKVEGEMIVKKLNLQTNADTDDIPTLLLKSKDDRPVKRKKRRMDAFFDMGEDNGLYDNDVNGPNDESYDETDTEKNDGRTFERSIQPTMSAFTTCFVGSLKSSDMMACKDGQYRSNEDWKRIRHEAKEQKFGRGRGSDTSFLRGRGGRGPAFRGRGQSPHRGSQFVPQRGRGRGRGFDQSGESRHGDRRGPDSGNAGAATQSGKEKVLHPSWEASKKRKQEQKGILQAFAGKKVKFDD